MASLVACLPLLGSPPGGPYLVAQDVTGLDASSGEAARDIRRLGVAMRPPRWAETPIDVDPRVVDAATSID